MPVMPKTPTLTSRLPQVGTTIFSVMSALATQTGAVNLGQGFPDFDCDERLIDEVTKAMREGHNQYPPMPGVPALRQAMAAKMQALYGLPCDPDTDITVTAGATQAILTAIERQDPDAARAAMRTHLGNSRERRRRLLEPAR